MASFTLISLYNSSVCRICSSESIKRIKLFQNKQISNYNIERWILFLSQYFPLKIRDDGILPSSMCNDCYDRLAATVEFLDTVIKGQNKIRDMAKQESLLRKAIKKQKSSSGHQNTSLVEYADVSISEPQRKRGRPKKSNLDKESVQGDSRMIMDLETIPSNIKYESEIEGRPKRHYRKCPERLSEAIAGRELDRVLCEEGVVDEWDVSALSDDEEAFHSQESENIDKSGEDSDQKDKENAVKTTEIKETKNEGERYKAESIQHTQNGAPFECKLCNRKFNYANSLAYHNESNHNKGEVFQCSTCNKRFRHRQLLAMHQTTHSENRPCKCDVCGATFKTKSNLRHHEITHRNEKKYTCDLCENSYATKTGLNVHILWHSGIKPHKCSTCSKAYTQKGNLKEHMRIHSGEKPFICSFCNRAFATSSQWKLHTKLHTGERPWKCQYCEKTFLYKEIWKTHERRHTGEKPFECAYCKRGFAEQWALKKHLRLHTGERPYQCNICEKYFADCSNLAKHKKVHMTLNSQSNASDLKVKTLPQSLAPYVISQAVAAAAASVATVCVNTDVSGVAPAPATSVVTQLLDEDGNSVQLFLQNGSTAELLSVDECNVLQARTSEGWIISLQLPSVLNLADEELLERIGETIYAASVPKVKTLPALIANV